MVANTWAKSSGEPVSHREDWNFLMDGIWNEAVGEVGGVGTSVCGGVGGRSASFFEGDGRGWLKRFLAIPALFTSRSM